MEKVEGTTVVGVSLEPDLVDINRARQRVICEMIERLGPEPVAVMLVLKECKIMRAERLRDRLLNELEKESRDAQ